MPVMIVLPAIAGFAAGAISVSMGLTVLGSTLVAATLVGAVAGAVVGGLGAAITGGDITDGILYGAVGGAVGGFLGGMYGPELFGAEGSTSSAISGGTEAVNPAYTSSVGFEGSSTPTAFEGFYNSAGSIGVEAGKTTAGLGMSDMAQYALLSGGADMLKGDAEVPYSNTEAAQASAIAAAKEKSAAEIAAQERIAKLDADTSMSNQALSASTTREGYASQERQAAEAIAQRKLELTTPIEQANLARARSMETASGLTLARKQASGVLDPYAENVG